MQALGPKKDFRSLQRLRKSGRSVLSVIYPFCLYLSAPWEPVLARADSEVRAEAPALVRLAEPVEVPRAPAWARLVVPPGVRPEPASVRLLEPASVRPWARPSAPASARPWARPSGPAWVLPSEQPSVRLSAPVWWLAAGSSLAESRGQVPLAGRAAPPLSDVPGEAAALWHWRQAS